VPVGKVVGGSGVIGPRDNHSVLGAAVARYSRGDSSVTAPYSRTNGGELPECGRPGEEPRCPPPATAPDVNAATCDDDHLVPVCDLPEGCGAGLSLATPADHPCEQVRLVLDSDGQGLPPAELTPCP
jgi:hypothetical protein